MPRTTLVPAATVAIIVAVGIPVHYLAGLDWPLAALIGAAVSIVLRFLIHPDGRRGLST